MATGFGIQEIKTAEATGDAPAVYQGTTATDIQTITAARYTNPGILTGAQVVKRADWKIDIAPGGVVMNLGSTLAVEVPVYAQTMDLEPAPATGERVDTVYVRQAATQSDNLARVEITAGAAPAGTVVLDRLRVTAGATRSSQLASVHDRSYARHSQSTQGVFTRAVDQGGDVRTKGKTYKAMEQRFTTETDRWVNLKLSVTAGRTNTKGESSIGTIGGTAASLRYSLYIDNALVRTFEVGIDRRWITTQLESLHRVKAGPHTVHVVSEWENDGDMTANTSWVVRWGGTRKFNGDALTVFDAGVAV